MRESRSVKGSRISTRNGTSISTEKPFPEIPDWKWNEMLQEEEFDMFILQIREEIMERCEDICYENYMNRQAVSFTINCAYLAWVKVINIYYMPRDEGDQEPPVKESWVPDDEPEPANVDSWAMDLMGTSKELPTTQEREDSLQSDSSTIISRSEMVSITPSVYCPESSRFGEDEFGYAEEFPGESVEIFLPKKSSVFTRTLTMSRELLPLFEPLNLSLGQCREEVTAPRKKVAEDVIQPTFIDVSSVPPNRIDVEYAVPDSLHHGTLTSIKKERKRVAQN